MTILNQRKKRRAPGALKWIILLAVLAAILYMLYWLGGEQPMTRVVQPVEAGDTAEAGGDSAA